MCAACPESKRAACHAQAALFPVLRSTPCPREREQGTEVRSQAGAADGYSMPSTLRVRLMSPPSSMISRMNGGNG